MKLHLLCAAFAFVVLSGGAWAQQSTELKPPGVSVGLGSSHFALGEFGQAAKAFKQYVALKPGADGHFWLGESLYRARSYAAAIDAFRKAIEAKPDNPRAHYHLGESYYRLNAFEDAEKEYRQTIKIDPTN